MPKKRSSGYQGLGGNSFQEDMERGLGKRGDSGEEPQSSNQDFGGFDVIRVYPLSP